MKKTAIITGITGQDGMYLVKFLLDKGYRVVGVLRSISQNNYAGFDYLCIKEKILFESCDLQDIAQIIHLFKKYRPDEVYNLAAQSSVGESFTQPIGTINFNIISVLNLLESIKILEYDSRFYQASSSEMYGKVDALPVSENTPMHPLSPYAVSKASAHWITTNYREAYRLFNCCGILFNHESFLRRDSFFVKKVMTQAVEIKNKKREKLYVGNIHLKRDFGYAPKYVEAIWLMMQQSSPADYLVCSGESVSLSYIIEYVFDRLNLSMNAVEVSPALLRPTEIQDIYGDNSKAKTMLGWEYPYRFSKLPDSIAVYDAFFELDSGIFNRLTNQKLDVCIDLNGSKSLLKIKAEYLISSRKCTRPLKKYALNLYPYINNILMGMEDNSLDVNYFSLGFTNTFKTVSNVDVRALDVRRIFFDPGLLVETGRNEIRRQAPYLIGKNILKPYKFIMQKFNRVTINRNE